MTDDQIIQRLLPGAKGLGATLLNTPGGFALMAAPGCSHDILLNQAVDRGMSDLCEYAYGIPLWTIPWQKELPSGYERVG